MQIKREVKLMKIFIEAFNSLKNSLVSEPTVNYQRKHRLYSLIVDASTSTSERNGGLGALLCQQMKKEKKE
jgi:hypothetical protein